ncbi:Rrf2 family transcriptional regulator [Deinococcus sp.]|uniref:Rrf2 family transcriptional regulator n=1 Tax=Deinococcus sp. TaxID=47478 RepID=UPI003C7D9510
MNSQFSVAAHMLVLVQVFPGPLSSESIADSVGVNPVVVRQVSGLLRRAGLLETRRGVAGATLTRPAEQITLLDVYRAVNAPQQVLKMHPHPNPQCSVGANIQTVLNTVYAEAQAALEARLARMSLADVVRDLQRQAG